MKVCERCGDEISTKDGENFCAACEDADELAGKKRSQRNAMARARRKEQADVMESLGLVKVRGALGGTYWE